MSVKNQEHRTVHGDVSRTLYLATGDNPTTVGVDFCTVPTVAWQIFAQKIEVHVKTAAAQALTFQDAAGTPVVIAILPASAAVGDSHVLLDSPEGVPLTRGKNLALTGAAGVGATIMVTAFRKPTGVLTPAEI